MSKEAFETDEGTRREVYGDSAVEWGYLWSDTKIRCRGKAAPDFYLLSKTLAKKVLDSAASLDVAYSEKCDDIGGEVLVDEGIDGKEYEPINYENAIDFRIVNWPQELRNNSQRLI